MSSSHRLARWLGMLWVLFWCGAAVAEWTFIDGMVATSAERLALIVALVLLAALGLNYWAYRVIWMPPNTSSEGRAWVSGGIAIVWFGFQGFRGYSEGVAASPGDPSSLGDLPTQLLYMRVGHELANAAVDLGLVLLLLTIASVVRAVQQRRPAS